MACILNAIGCLLKFIYFCLYTITQHEWAKNTSTNMVKSLAFSLSVLTFHISS